MTIIWSEVPEIWNVTDKNFCHFGPFFAFSHSYQPKKSKFWKNEKSTWRCYHLTDVYHKWKSYDVWFLRYEVWWTFFVFILDRFLPFYLPNSPKIKFWKGCNYFSFGWTKGLWAWNFSHLSWTLQKVSAGVLFFRLLKGLISGPCT